MPTRQIPLLSPEGIHQDNDTAGLVADYRFFLNGYFEDHQGLDDSRKMAYVKRPGISALHTSGFAPGHYIQGIISSIDRTTMIAYSNNGSDENKTWFIDNNFDVIDTGAAPAASDNWTYTGPVIFTALDNISYGPGVIYAATDFNKGAVITNIGGWTEITDSVFTGLNKTTNFIGLDGYLFIGTANNRIYNSDLNDSETWGALNFISVNDTPGRLLWLAKIRNYLIAFKDKSIEFFEDVGAPAPGSPLEARKSLNSRVGLLHRNTIQEVSDGIIFVGTTEAGMSQVYKISNVDLSIKPISTRYIEQNLTRIRIALTTDDYSVDAVASDEFMGQSQVAYILGKEFYFINIPSVVGDEDHLTQVYDNQLGMWVAWATSFVTEGETDPYGFQATQAQEIVRGGLTFTVFVDNSHVDESTSAVLVAVNPTSPSWQDLDTGNTAFHNYPFSWTSDQFDFGSRKRKFMDTFEVLYTSDSSAVPSNSANNVITLVYRDFDYNQATGRKVTRTLYYDPGGGVRAIARRLGQFRKRSFSLYTTTSHALQLWAIEVQYNQGETDQES